MFNKQFFLREFRWLFVVAAIAWILMLYGDITGRRLFSSSTQQQWSSSGPGYHK